MKKKASRRRIDVNVDELDRIIDAAMREPLSETDGRTLKTAVHAMAERLVRRRNTEKTSAVLAPKAPPAAVDTQQPEKQAAGHGRNGAAAFTGANRVRVAELNRFAVIRKDRSHGSGAASGSQRVSNHSCKPPRYYEFGISWCSLRSNLAQKADAIRRAEHRLEDAPAGGVAWLRNRLANQEFVLFCGAGISVSPPSSAPAFLELRTSVMLALTDLLVQRDMMLPDDRMAVETTLGRLDRRADLSLPPELVFHVDQGRSRV